MEHVITAALLADVLEAAEMDGDEVTVRLSYKGRGWAPEGFGITTSDNVQPDEMLASLMMAAGYVAGQHEDDEEDIPDLSRWARSTRSDSMGRGTIYYWPGWTIGGNVDDLSDWMA